MGATFRRAQPEESSTHHLAFWSTPARVPPGLPNFGPQRENRVIYLGMPMGVGTPFHSPDLPPNQTVDRLSAESARLVTHNPGRVEFRRRTTVDPHFFILIISDTSI